MNEYTIIPISTTDLPLLGVDSVYTAEDKLAFFTWANSELAQFPWISVLKNAGELKIGLTVSTRSIVLSKEEHHVDIETTDLLGLNMMGESASLTKVNTGVYHEWVRLPEDLAWLYDDRPYMISSDVSSVSSELWAALDTRIASEELTKYVGSRTYAYAYHRPEYSSYGSYYDPNLVQDLKNTVARLKLGEGVLRHVSDLASVYSSGELSLDVNDADLVEILIQMRVGDYICCNMITVEVDQPISTVYLSNGAVGSKVSLPFNDEVRFGIMIDLLYGETRQLPIWCNADIVYTTRDVPIAVLVSAEGSIPMCPPLKLRLGEQILENGVLSTPVSGSTIHLDNAFLSCDILQDEIVYAEYHHI